MENVKKYINPALYIVAGLFNFIWLALSHFTVMVSGFGESESRSMWSGYEMISESARGADGSFFKVLAAIALIVIIIVSIALIVIGVVKLLKTLGISVIPEKFKNYFILATAISTFAIFAAAIAAFFFTLVFGLCNCESGYGISIVYLPGVGCWFMLVWAVATFITFNKLVKKFDFLAEGEFADASSTKYVCTKCGKSAKSTDKFCTACGAPVAETLIKYLCTGCGKEVKKGVNFCPDCGSAIEAKDFAKKENAEA